MQISTVFDFGQKVNVRGSSTVYRIVGIYVDKRGHRYLLRNDEGSEVREVYEFEEDLERNY